MKVLYGEGRANHTGPESCGAAREGVAEALTGVRMGRVLSRESFLRDADAVMRSGRRNRDCRYREAGPDPARSETPSTSESTLHGNRDIPCPPGADGASGRIAKSKDVRR